MPRPRTRYCPQGHDKDAPGGSYWFWTRTLKGTPVRQRDCKICRGERKKMELHQLNPISLLILRIRQACMSRSTARVLFSAIIYLLSEQQNPTEGVKASE